MDGAEPPVVEEDEPQPRDGEESTELRSDSCLWASVGTAVGSLVGRAGDAAMGWTDEVRRPLPVVDMPSSFMSLRVWRIMYPLRLCSLVPGTSVGRVSIAVAHSTSSV
jgi:hypothetical protein